MHTYVQYWNIFEHLRQNKKKPMQTLYMFKRNFCGQERERFNYYFSCNYMRAIMKERLEKFLHFTSWTSTDLDKDLIFLAVKS